MTCVTINTCNYPRQINYTNYFSPYDDIFVIY